MAEQTIFERFLTINRRWIFLVLGLVVVIALLLPPSADVRVTTTVIRFYQVIETSDPAKPLIIAVDTPPSGLPELEPMIVGILQHCFKRSQPVILLALQMEGVSIAERLVEQVQSEYNARAAERGDTRRIKMGEDWALLGYRAGFSAVILGLGDDVRAVFPTDLYGNYLDEMPLFDDYHNYADTAAVVDISWSSTPELWVQFAGGPFGVPILVGCTAVSAPQYYAYLQTDQMSGLLGGLKGAAEYEKLINEPASATRGMVAQTGAHLLIVILIVLGNIAYFAIELRKRREKKKHQPH